MPAPNFWPRLYLDTAELIDIADGRTDPSLVNDVIAAMERHAVILVVSGDHLRMRSGLTIRLGLIV